MTTGDRDDAKRVLNEARDTIRSLTEATNLVSALVALSEVSEIEVSMQANKLGTVTDALLVDLNRCFRTLRKGTGATNNDGKVDVTSDVKTKAD